MPGQRQKGKGNVRKFRKREIKYPTAEEPLAIITDTFGYCNFGCEKILDKSSVLAKPLNSFSKGPRKVLLKKNDYVLLKPLGYTLGKSGKQGFQIIYIYNIDELKELKKKGFLESQIQNLENTQESKILFGEENSIKEDILEDEELDIDNI